MVTLDGAQRGADNATELCSSFASMSGARKMKIKTHFSTDNEHMER